MTREEAEAIATRELEARFAGGPGEPVILAPYTEEHPDAWVFYYQSRRFLETGETSLQLAGNPPLVIDRAGRVHWLPTSAPPRAALEELRSSGALNA